MIAKMRGGPKHGKKMEVQDNTRSIEVAGNLKMTKRQMKRATKSWYAGPALGGLTIPARGTYSRTLEPFPDGSYAFVWLGWREEQELLPTPSGW